MTVRLSYDEGRTWPVAKPLQAGPSAYSCMTILAALIVGCLYERGDRGAHEKIRFARFNLEWITDGRDVIATRRPEGCRAWRSVRSPSPHRAGPAVDGRGR